jgi:hypothetical protein
VLLIRPYLTILSGEIKKANHPFVTGITPTGHWARSGVMAWT